MSLIVGTNSYVSLEEANTLVNDYFTKDDPANVAWQSASNEDKETYLQRACLQIDSLPLRGTKKDRRQLLSFPRKDGDMHKVKLAQVIQAVSFTDTALQDDNSARQRLRQAGVVQYSIGNLSETFGKGMGTGSISNVVPQVTELLRSYLTGGFKICI